MTSKFKPEVIIQEGKLPLRKADLTKVSNLKNIFNEINNFLYSSLKYTNTDTRTRSMEIINFLIAKLIDETTKTDNERLELCIYPNEDKEDLYKRIQNFFNREVKVRFNKFFKDNDSISLDKESLFYIVKSLQHISLLESSRDVLNDAYEIFVSKILKDQGGQYFTPSNIIKFMIQYLDPELNSKILDPACGHGGFLLECKDYLLNKTVSKDNHDLEVKIKKKIGSNLYGIDKDLFLTRLCGLYLNILCGTESNVYCENTLDPSNYRKVTIEAIMENKFDYILTNPPFGARISVNEREILGKYELGHLWKNNSEEKWRMKSRLVKQRPPQILFIERCVQLLRNGGKMAIILPEGLFGNSSDRYIWDYLYSKGKILAVVSLDQNTFQPYTCNKASILFFQKLSNIPDDYWIDFGIVDNIGHNKDGKILYKLNKDGTKCLSKDGKPIINDDLPNLHKKLKNALSLSKIKNSNEFKLKFSKIKRNIFIPSYYIGVEKVLYNFREDKNYDVLQIHDLAKKGIIYTNSRGYIPRGDEIGSSVYGLGKIPFVRTSELENWGINLDTNKKTSEEVYEQYKLKQQIEEGDILIVKDGGPNLIGKTAFVTEIDTKIIIQSHIYQIKVLKNEFGIDPYLLLYLLNLDIVKRQIEAITFVQGTLASIGNRIMELSLPIPKSYSKKVDVKKAIRNVSLESFLNN
ncbi:MAG: N-6 DNA methylase [Candidatus Lokiarchaeota archaeon]